VTFREAASESVKRGQNARLSGHRGGALKPYPIDRMDLIALLRIVNWSTNSL